MHACNLAWKSQFAIVSSCSCSCPWWDVICCCLISNMAAFNLSNWVQATAMRVLNRYGKPQVVPSSIIVVIHCKNAREQNYNVLKLVYSGILKILIATQITDGIKTPLRFRRQLKVTLLMCCVICMECEFTQIENGITFWLNFCCKC